MKRLLTLLSAASVLGACTLDPAYKRPASPAPASFPQGPSYAPAPASPSPDVAQMTWRQAFTDPALQKVIALALEQNRDLRVAAANIQQAHAQFVVTRSAIFPNISGTGGEYYTRTPNPLGGAGFADERFYSATVGLSQWEIDLFGRLRSQTRAAFDQYLAQADNRRAVQTSLISQVATGWYTLAADQQLLAVAQQTLASQRASLDIISARFNAGVASMLDVQEAQTSAEQARSDVANYTTQAAQAKNALDLLVGSPVSADLLPTTLPETGGVADLQPGLDAKVLLTRPDVLQAEHELMGYNADIGAARAAFFPQVTLTGNFGQESTSLQRLFGRAARTWLFEPDVTVPLFQAGKNVGNLKSAKAQRDAAVATYEKAIQTAFREVADALARQGTIGEQIAAQKALVEAASGSYQLSNARYERGADTYLNALIAQRTLYTAQQSLVDAELTRLTNLATLYQALGGGQT